METDNRWKKYVLIPRHRIISVIGFRILVLKLYVFLILNFLLKNCLIILDKRNYILLENNIYYMHISQTLITYISIISLYRKIKLLDIIEVTEKKR